MSLPCRLLPGALQELAEAAAWYEERRDSLGTSFLDAVERVVQEIVESPLRFAKLETTQSQRHIRRRIIEDFPYLVIYELRSDEILVAAVAHTSRQPDYWLSRSTDE